MWIFINLLFLLLRFLTRVITKLCYVKVWIFSKWLVSMLFQNAGGVAAIAAVPHARQLYPHDMHWGTLEAMFQTYTKILYRKRRTACCSVTDVRVSGTWQLIADTCRVVSAVVSHIALSFVQGHATTPYVAIAPGLTMLVDPFLCRVISFIAHFSTRTQFLTNIHYIYL